MWLRRVHARAFGALADQTLELGPGLNIVVGPNESGKSTWHAALYAALCGLPEPGAERFAAYRRPRRLQEWAVGVELELAGAGAGRQIAIEQNLLDPDASSVVDLDSGTDLGAEIATPRGPDASRWLGFDRRSYAATSWVEQAGARNALVSSDGRNALQLAVAVCIGEDEADAALARLEAALRGYVGDEATGARGAAAAAVTRWRAAEAEAQRRHEARAAAVTALAAATGATEIARKRVLAARAFEARREADRLRKDVAAPGHEAEPELDGPHPGDTEVHSTVTLALLELRRVDDDIEDLGVDEASDPLEPAPADEVNADAKPRLRLPSLRRFPRLDQIWGLDRVPALRRIGALSQRALLGIVATAALVVVASIVLAVVLSSLVAVAVALVAALLVLAALAQLTPSPQAASGDPVTIIRSGPSTPDLRLRRDVALAKLSSALTARGVRARPLTAEADYDRYVEACAAAAREQAVADEAARQRWADQEEARLAREADAERAEREAAEHESAADPYDLGLPYRPSLVEAHTGHQAALRDLAAATAALAQLDRDIEAHGALPELAQRRGEAEARVRRVARLDEVLQRARLELTLAREAVLRDIASGIAPRMSDYLAELTDRRFTVADRHDLQDQIGASLLRREPELGSFSTSESTFLFTRVALGQHLAGDAPQGPLLVDDITSSADSDRIRRMLGILRRISTQRQVVVFAHQSQVRKWAQRRIGADAGIRLIRLTSASAPPQLVAPPPPPEPRAPVEKVAEELIDEPANG